MAFDRKNFQASAFDAIKQEEKKAKATNKTFTNNNNTRVGFYKIEDGENWMRVLPAHKGGDPAYVSIRSAQLKCYCDEWKDGEKTGRQVLQNKKVFIATQHCDAVREAGLPDPIEFYIQKVYEKAEEFQDDSDRKKFLIPIEGAGSGKNWQPGIIPSSGWICYVLNEDREMSRVELRPNWFTILQKKSLALAEESEKVSLDMFSDPDEGFPLYLIKGVKSVKGQDRVYYDIEAVRPKRSETWEEFFEKNRVTDDELQELLKQPSLQSLYVNSYTTRDLELAIDGLKNLEVAHPEYDILGTREFEDLINELMKIVPEPQKEEDAVEEAFKKEESSEITPLKMKKYLREYIQANYTDEGYELPSDLSKEDLVKWYKLAMEGDELPFEDYGDNAEDSGKANAEAHDTQKAAEKTDGVKEYDPNDVKARLKGILGKK